MNKGRGLVFCATLLVASILLSLFAYTPSAFAAFVPGKDSTQHTPSWDSRWNFRARPVNKSDIQFSWHQPAVENIFNPYPARYTIQVAAGTVLKNQFGNNVSTFCDSSDAAIWQTISQHASQPYVGGRGEGIQSITVKNLRFDEQRNGGLYFRLLLHVDSGFEVSFGKGGLNPFEDKHVGKFPGRSQPYLIGCDNEAVQSTASPDQSQENVHSVTVTAIEKESPTKDGESKKVAMAYTVTVAPGSTRVDSKLPGYTGKTRANESNETIRIDQKVLGYTDNDPDRPLGYRVTGTYNGKSDSKTSANNADRTLTFVFYKDGSKPTVTEEHKDKPGTTEDAALEQSVRESLREDECSYYLSPLNKYKRMLPLAYANCQFISTIVSLLPRVLNGILNAAT